MGREVELCVIKKAATYSFWVRSFLWRTTTASALPPPTKGMCTLLSKCTLGPEANQA